MKTTRLNRFLLGLEICRKLKPQEVCGWTPIKIQFRPEGPVVAWLNLQNIDFRQPRFFKQIIEAYTCSQEQRNKIFITPIETLTALQTLSPGLAPTGFIFHVSRCGSTLLSNMLSARSQNLVLSEPNIINKVLLAPRLQYPEETVCNWLRAVIYALGQPYLGLEENYFIKFSSWNILSSSLIKTAFPEVPGIIVYRDPVEVMVSQLNTPGGWMRAKRNPASVARRVGLPAGSIAEMDKAEYCARVLGNFYEAAAQAVDDRTMVVNYDQLSEAILRRWLAFVGVAVSDEAVSAMVDRMHFYAKDPHQQQRFEDDRAYKQSLATPAIRTLVNKWVQGAYEKLETTKESIS